MFDFFTKMTTGEKRGVSSLWFCTMWNATSKSGKIGAPLTKMVITQCTMGQFGSNFQELLLRHVPQ